MVWCFTHAHRRHVEAALQSNLLHIVINNGAHDSVGGQPTAALQINLQKIADGFGYLNIKKATTAPEVKKALGNILAGSTFLRSSVKGGIEKN